MDLTRRIQAFASLGETLRNYLNNKGNTDTNKHIADTCREAREKNPWFTDAHIRYAMGSWASALTEQKLEKWASPYPKLREQSEAKTVATVMAGNIPLVGFHDMLSILMSGHHVLAKASGKDEVLIRLMANLITGIEPAFGKHIRFSEELMRGFDAVIATGSNNTARLFGEYFGKYPNIIRHNRNSVAILTGNESNGELEKLSDDIFLYFGMGCRNVSKLYLPEGYDPAALLPRFEKYAHLSDHHKYANNYDYNKALLLLNKTKHLDSGFVLLTENEEIASPLSVLYYEHYPDRAKLEMSLDALNDHLQCRVGKAGIADTPFGQSQKPELWDYADGVDTLDFLTHL